MDQMKQHYNRSVYDSMFKVHIALIYSLFENDSPLTLKALNLLENRVIRILVSWHTVLLTINGLKSMNNI